MHKNVTFFHVITRLNYSQKCWIFLKKVRILHFLITRLILRKAVYLKFFLDKT